MSTTKTKPAQDQAQQPLVETAVVQPPKKETPKVATKSTTPEFDLSKMSVEDMLALSAKLAEAAKAQGQKLFDETMTFLSDKLKAMGRSKEEAMRALYELMTFEERRDFTARFRQFVGAPAPAAGGATAKTRAARGTKPAREYVDKDSTGARPENGKTYVLNGQAWKKAESGKGATKKEFIDAVKGGALWSEMLKK